MHKVVKQLEALIKKHGWKDKFEEAINNAAKYNVPRIKNIRNLDDYLKWIDALLRWVPMQDPKENRCKEVYNHICEFYFFLDQPPVKGLQNKILPHEKAPKLTPLSKWMVDYADAWGEYLDTTKSFNRKALKSFEECPNFNMDEYMAPPSGYLTFNQFFARHVKPGMRPIAAIGDPSVVVSPADCTFQGWWQINENSRITVKGLEWSIHELLQGSPYADAFKGGVFTHSFLNTTDYHRLHVPLDGKVLESRTIHGQVYLNVEAVPVDPDDTGPGCCHHIRSVREFDATDYTGYQFAQARGLIVLDTPVGLVAVLPIGMAQVSSVVMTAEVGKHLFKGQEFSYFQFGGSDIVMLFEAASQVTFSAQVDVHYNQGTCIARAYP